jgi:hypothetical protein
LNHQVGQGGSVVIRSILLLFAGFIGIVLSPILVAQQPKPPALLPPSISGRPYEPVVPASGVVAKSNPIDRFQTPGYPTSTLATLEAAKDAAGWLTRMSKADGRFVAGFDATLQRELPGDEIGQAMGCLALAQMAKFSGDERATIVTSQAILTLLSLTKMDTADATIRIPKLTAEQGNRVAFAAVLATAIYELPNPDAKLIADADYLCRYLYSRLKNDGSIQLTDGTEPSVRNDPDEMNQYPGLCFQAIMASDRIKPEQWKRDALERGVKFYREQFQTRKTTEMCGSMLPAMSDYTVRVKSKSATAFVLEMADWVCDQQYTATDARLLRWVGGFRPSRGTEPTATSAACIHGLAAAVTLTTQIPDAVRFERYRKAALSGLTFTSGLRFHETNTTHFERAYRNRLLGGIHGSATDSVIRVEQTGRVLLAQLRYLESGAERAE